MPFDKDYSESQNNNICETESDYTYKSFVLITDDAHINKFALTGPDSYKLSEESINNVIKLKD